MCICVCVCVCVCVCKDFSSSFFVVCPKREKSNFFSNVLRIICSYIRVRFHLVAFVRKHVAQGHMNRAPNETRNLSCRFVS